ncbi:MAG: 4Fe-4S dicluster domain-containing protein [Gemmataceae bacterium]|nr:ferredoxin family protein [Gemmata sp.]MDW8197511.1 4Fe-4S dicluster domain-containing protein [Gemmataceae bacterium]
MARSRVTVVLSQAPGKHPGKRALEESIVAALLMEPELEVSVVPHLYDLHPDHTGMLFLESVSGDMVVLSWLYPRAAFWLLDRNGIKGHWGASQLQPPADEEDEADAETDTPVDKPEPIGASGPIPERYIYTLDLRDSNKYEDYVAEVKRIAAECRQRRATQAHAHAAENPPLLQLGRALRPSSALTSTAPPAPPPDEPSSAALPAFTPEALLAPTGRRWYPVIDYNRCTNCLECLDFCLFGVYGVDAFERIIVENQDQCKKGCPACSRVCPQQAIMFPEYKSPAIAGANTGTVGGLKIDLSRLFGGEAGDALALAVQERDRELVNDGRAAVGMTVGIPKRQTHKPQAPKDELDKLVDDLDNLGL